MRLGQQPPDPGVDIPVRRPQQRHDVQDPPIVGDDVAGATPQHGVGEPADVTADQVEAAYFGLAGAATASQPGEGSEG